MSYNQYSVSTNTTRSHHDNNYGWYECNCCPYGYHIDLDFVRYCDSITQETERTGSIKRRKDRRRQRQSMEVLLGIPPTPAYSESVPVIQEQSPQLIQKQLLQIPLFQDGFDDAITDFERTLQRSKNKLSNNLPDVTAVAEHIRRVPSSSSMSSASGSSLAVLAAEAANTAPPPPPSHQDFDAASIESSAAGLSAAALQNIRERMALSLKRTRQLEEQVQMLPDLQEEIISLKDENSRLKQRLKEEEVARMNTINANIIETANLFKRHRSHSHSQIDHLDDGTHTRPKSPPKRDMGIMCTVLTRHIGVGHQNPNTKTASTATTESFPPDLSTSDKWLKEKTNFLHNTSTSEQSTQSVSTPSKSTPTQTVPPPPPPRQSDFSVQKTVECYSIGCSEDTINDVSCEKCSVFKRTIAVGPEDPITIPVNLASLAQPPPRSKSFNLGPDKLNLSSRQRSIKTQTETNVVSRSCQHHPQTQSKSNQATAKLTDKTTQSEPSVASSKTTDTKDLIPPGKHVACEASTPKPSTSHVACNTNSTTPTELCKCNSKDDIRGKDGSPNPSRIPRPQIPTTPVENRKFRRQDTYTKIYTAPGDKLEPTSPGARLSGLDLSTETISSEAHSSPLDKVKQNFKFPEVSSATTSATKEEPPPVATTSPTEPSSSTSTAQNGVNSEALSKVQVPSALPEATFFQPISQNPNRKKATPSKEMQGAMKVLNDSLLKNPSGKALKNHSAVNIVQKEWFKISSSDTANPLDVEDYLDSFEDMSSQLLQYVVNMSDSSGNTAMHYAVSHGNFDVVSILLDSKVCDINKPNTAGYTSVMLVSLAEVRSQTHASVVKRLFKLADVNIRAKRHGQTALMLAVSHGRLDMVNMLLGADADINIQDEDGSTALMCAAEHGHIEIVKHFLSQPDCDSSITDVDGSTALKIAMEAGHKHIGVLLYAHERNHQKLHGAKIKKISTNISPKPPSSPLPIKNSYRALTDTTKPK